MASKKECIASLSNANVKAFMKVIQFYEAGAVNRYDVIYTGAKFNLVPGCPHPNKAMSSNGVTSTAAGAYQFNFKTWNEIKTNYGLTDFYKENQVYILLFK